MTAECFLLLAPFFVLGDGVLRDAVHSELKTIHAVCFFGKISMRYLAHLDHFLESYKNAAAEDMDDFVQALRRFAASESD